MLELLRIELSKLYHKPRALIAFVAVGVLVGAVHLVMVLQGEQLTQLVLQGIQQRLSIQGRILHGYLVAFIVQGMLLVHLPFLVALIGGDMVGGESAAGTLRLLILQPVPRWKIAIAKAGALLVYSAILVAFLALTALVIGIAVWGTGDLLVLSSNGVVVLRAESVLWRFVLSYAYNVVGLYCVGMLALMLGCIVDNPLGPVLGTFSVVIVMTALSLLDVPLIDQVKQLFFTTHIAAWRLLFEEPIPGGTVLRSFMVVLGHIVVFCVAAALILQHKDILT